MSTTKQAPHKFIKAQNLDLSSLTFAQPKITDRKARMIFVNELNTKRQIVLQTPKMYIPSGMKMWEADEADKDDTYEVELSFGGDSEEVRAFHQKMKDYDALVKKEIFDNPMKFLNKQKVGMETIEESIYVPTIRPSLDKEKKQTSYPDKMKVKIDREKVKDGKDANGKDKLRCTGEFSSNNSKKSRILAFDSDRKPIEFNESNYKEVIPKGCSLICLIELVYVFSAQSVSTKWKLVQFITYRENTALNEFAFDLPEEDNIVDDTVADELRELKSLEDLTVKDTVTIEDVDEVVEEGTGEESNWGNEEATVEESEEVTEEEVVPEPEPVKKAPVIRKKKA